MVVCNPMGAVLFQTRYIKISLVSFINSSYKTLVGPTACDTPFLLPSDMQLLEWCSPGFGRLCGTLRLCLVGAVMSWKASRPPAPLTGTAETLGTCPTSSCTFSFALLCLSLSSWCLTRNSCGRSARWAMQTLVSLSDEKMTPACTSITMEPFRLYSGVTGEQAAGIWGWQHKSCGGAGGTYGSGDGAGLPRDLAAVCCHGPCCHNWLQSVYWPRHYYHSCLLG